MKVIKINLNNLKESIGAIEEAVKIMRAGGSIVYPTDTIYGIGVDASNPEAISRLFAIKRRLTEKAIPVIVSDITMAKKIAYIDYKKEKALKKIWPAPITIILQKKDFLPNILTGIKNTVGVRISNSRLAITLVASLGKPITATSANISGENSSPNIQDIINRFNQTDKKPDLILDVGILSSSNPSTILDLSGLKPKIIRVGPIKKDQLLDILSI